MSGKTVEDCTKEIKNLENKAGLSREICAYQYRKYKFISNILSIVILLSSASIALLSIADPEILLSLPFFPKEQQFTKNVIAILGFLILILSYSDKIFGLTESMNKSEQGVKSFTDYIRDSHTFRDVGSKDCDETTAGLKLESIKEEYNHLNQILSLNSVSDMTFLRIKKAHLLKKKVSKLLDSDPNINLKEYYTMNIRDWFFWRLSKNSETSIRNEQIDDSTPPPKNTRKLE